MLVPLSTKIRSLTKAAIAFTLAGYAFIIVGVGQGVGSVEYKSQEISETDGVPVLLKHLPEWESKRSLAALATSTAELRTIIGETPLLDAIEFTPGTEAATAPYAAGRLIIVEYASPQLSVETDQKITAYIAAANDGRTFHRRIGNYNVVVTDGSDPSAANDLIDQVKYEKKITWLGNNPFAISAERAFVLTTADIFISTLIVIVGGAVLSVIGGLIVGYIFFNLRDRRKAAMAEFSDAGGMIRLNLDGFTPDIVPKRLLGE